MKNVAPAFEFRDDYKMPIGFKLIDCHMIFNIKSDLTRKARLVAGGNQTEEPAESIYLSVVSRHSVRIAFLIAALNGLKILAGDVQNAYLNAPTKECCYTIAGPKFGEANEGRPVMIVRALYGLRSSGARWCDHMASTLRSLGFKGCLADPDIWMKPADKPDGTPYYEYVLIYVDNILAILHEPDAIMESLSKHYTLKAGSVKVPDKYLGAQIRTHTIDPGLEPRTCWAMSCDKYVK
jgi:Reverse transcriptase (RNA-dependent DNA polymerase)